MRVLLLLALSAGIARGDGAFPDSFAMFAPPSQMGTLRLATNFGLVVSNDDAKTWHYVCEQAVVNFANLYAQGPDEALYAVSTLGLVSSRDGGCTWTRAQGALLLSAVDDVFADPSDGNHVLAIARVVQDGGFAGETEIFRSRDGGVEFGPALYTPVKGRSLTGVEIARSDPDTIYLTMHDSGPYPFVARSDDGGANFTLFDLGAMVGNMFPRLIAVDPTDPKRVFLRLSDRDSDSLGISNDGGATVQLALTMPGKMSAFLLRQDGTILVGGLAATGGLNFRSRNGGLSFESWPIDIHLRGLAERGTRLYLVGDDLLDGAALFHSDDGDTLTPVMRFRDIVGPAQCGSVPSTCAVPWSQLQPLVNPDFDGGVPMDLGMAPPDGGCGCSVSGGFPVLPFVCMFLVAVLGCRHLLRRG